MSSPQRPLERREVCYRGRVQGVGFRYTVVNIARRYEVTGYVQNLDDGRVKLVVEGPGNEVRLLIEDVAAALEGYIVETTSQQQPASGQFQTFDVRY